MLNKFLETLKSENTRITYGKAITDMLNHVGKPYDKIEYSDLSDYRVCLMDRYADNTVQTRLRAIDSFYGWLFNEFRINTNPTIARDGKELRLGKSIKKVREKTYIPMEKAVRLIDFGKNSRDRAIVAVYLTTGIRVSELVNLTLEDYENKHTVIITKGEKNRDIWFNQTACRYINEYLKDRKDSEYNNLFISNSCKPMNKQAINNTLKVLANRAGLPTDISNHQLRHTCISNAVKHSDIETTRRFIGHSTCAMTEKYTHSTQDEVNRLSEAMCF